MRKGTVIHLDPGETLPHQELAMADLVINNNGVIIKNRYGLDGARILNSCSGTSGPLDEGIFHDWEVAKNFSDSFESRINGRITEILDIVHIAFGENTDDYNWYFDGADEGQIGTIDISGDQIFYVYENGNQHNKFLETSEWDYTLGIPKKFLFMNNDEIAYYIKKQIERCAKKDAQKKSKREASKKQKEQKKKEILNRLSLEEKKILGLAD